MKQITHDYIQATLPFKGEGSINAEQIDFIQDFLRENPGIRRVVETGFNLGISAAAFLGASPYITAVSFDWLQHPDSLQCKNIIDGFFSGRHTLVAGDSLNSIKAFLAMGLCSQFDIAFVDGGHVWPVPYLDLGNMLSMLREEHPIMMDDYCPAYGQDGVIRAWDVYVKAGKISPILTQTFDNRGIALGIKV